MSLGIYRPARQRGVAGASPSRDPGVCTFAEDPRRASPDACLIWDANCDPDILPVTALPIDGARADGFDTGRFGRWFTLVTDPDGG